MSAERMPSRSEVMGWNPQRLADYLKRMSLSGCDKVVLKNSISGARFVNLSENDLQKFPKLHAPMISKICAEISKKEERRHFFGIFPSKNQEADAVAEVQGWDEGEFDDEEFDDDYESPFSGDEEGSGGDYESPNDDQDAANDYEPPPTEPLENQKLGPSLPISDDDYIDNRNNHTSSQGPPPAVCPRPPVSSRLLQPGDPAPSRRDHSPHAAGRAAGKPPAEPPQIFRQDKPGRAAQPAAAERAGTHSRRPQPDLPDQPTWSKPPVLPPPSGNRSNSSARPPNMFDSRREPTRDEALKHNTFPLHNKNQPPRPGLPGPPSRHGDSLPSNVPSGGSLPQKLHSALAEQRDRQPFRQPPSVQELDPSWYVGNVTRGQAENCLKRVRKDGAYLVRDSTRQQANQPFTLMVFYQDKVYNIQIRQQNQKFLLGTGLKVHEAFPSVSDIISHYSQSPLLLIDAKNRGSSQQNQCLLSDPAGYYMGRPNWT